MAQARRSSPFVLVVFAVFVVTTTNWFKEVEASPVDAHPAAAVNRHPSSAEAHELDSPRRVARQDDSVANSNAAEDQPRPALVNGNGVRRRPGATPAPADNSPAGALADVLGGLGQRLGQALARVVRRTFRQKSGGYGYGYGYGYGR